MLAANEPIIFIDDDVDDHFIFEEICKNLNLSNHYKFFHNGDAVLQYLRTTTDRPFIIFCDINMPQMNGLQLRKAINEDETLREKSIPFVFFSTAPSNQQIRQAYGLTVQGFFLKEQSFEETKNTFKLILEYWQKCKHPNSIK
ncbi:MAG: response regulator [Cyclobacteriaceae bacterium]